MNPRELDGLVEFAVQTAQSAGALTLRHFGRARAERKADGTPVTAADREAERFCREAIERRFPAHGILGEEFGAERAGARNRWIVDPIDGTRSFVRGVPLYGVLVAFESEGEPLLGVAHFPALGETLVAARERGCWLDGVRVCVSERAALAEALVLTSDPRGFPAADRLAGWERLGAAAGMVRTWGDCYGHALVATGRAEAMVDPVLDAWDAAALVPIVSEAGGVFTDWNGRVTHTGGSGIATNARLALSVRAALGAGTPAAR